MLTSQKTYLPVLLLFCCTMARAQQSWPSPEVEQMYNNAELYLAKKNYTDAIITFKQAIMLAPGKMILQGELGKAYYLSGNYTGAEQVLTALVAGKDTTGAEQNYQVLAAALTEQKKHKKARAVLQQGLSVFPGSGILHHQLGLVYLAGKDKNAAISTWIRGIEKEPRYAQNYYAAANAILDSKDMLWGLLYAEIYLNIEADTTGFTTLKKRMLNGYKTMFDNIAGTPKPSTISTFEQAVMSIFLSLTPVISDGVTAENLAMVRTRFLMDWQATYAATHPCSLFAYLDKLIRTGHFEIYNEWLFGDAESREAHIAWNTFHSGDIDRLLNWKKNNPLIPSPKDPKYTSGN